MATMTAFLRASIAAAVLLLAPRPAAAQPGYVGIQVQPMTEDVAKDNQWKSMVGVYVREVYRNGPGERAGLKPGDIIASFDGADVQGFNQLLSWSKAKEAGATAKLVVMRNGRRMTVDVTYDPQPTGDLGEAGTVRLADYGVTLAPLTALIKQRLKIVQDVGGVVVIAVEPGRPAAKGGLDVGDLITMVGDRTIADPSAFRDAMAAAAKDGRSAVPVTVFTSAGNQVKRVSVTNTP